MGVGIGELRLPPFPPTHCCCSRGARGGSAPQCRHQTPEVQVVGCCGCEVHNIAGPPGSDFRLETFRGGGLSVKLTPCLSDSGWLIGCHCQTVPGAGKRLRRHLWRTLGVWHRSPGELQSTDFSSQGSSSPSSLAAGRRKVTLTDLHLSKRVWGQCQLPAMAMS